MTKRKIDPKTKAVMDFFPSQGVTFVDAETGGTIEPELDRDKFANDFEEEHGWCPDAGYEEIKSTDDKREIKEAYEYMKRIKLNQKDITVSWDGGKTWYRDGKVIKSD